MSSSDRVGDLVIRVLLEGEPGKSEDMFWSNFFTKVGKSFLLYFCKGNKNIAGVVDEICADVDKNDLVLYCADRYTVDTYTEGIDTLYEARDEKGFILAVMESRSFEEIFLSYSSLGRFVRIGNKGLLDVFLDAASCVKERRNLNTKLQWYSKHLDKFGLKADIRTEERFVSWLLAQVTHEPREIRVEKRRIGSCWLMGCCEARDNVKRACPVGDSIHLSFLDKIKDLEKNSVLSTGDLSLLDL